MFAVEIVSSLRMADFPLPNRATLVSRARALAARSLGTHASTSASAPQLGEGVRPGQAFGYNVAYAAARRPHNALLASSAPCDSAFNFAHAICGWQRSPSPQSVEAATRSRPTIFANR